MPHFHIEYSANLEMVVDMGALCEAIRAAAAEIDTFPTPGIRVRATSVNHVAMADGDPKHAFVDLSVRMREGRPDDVKKVTIDRIFAALKDFMTPAMETHSIALSAEMRDIDAALSPKFGNVRDHMKDNNMSVLDNNIAKLDGYLARFRDAGIQNRIAGQDVVGSEGVFQTTSPVDKSVICDVAHGAAADIDAAASAAHAAFAEWRDMPASQRKKIIINIAEGIEARAEEIALCECWDSGQAYKFMSKAALRGAENFRYFADQVVQARDGQHLKSPTLMNITTRVPIGPVGVITPWNTPFMLSTWKIAPALAAGCTVVHKPAEASPLTARLLVEIAEEAGLPPGVLNTVNGFGEGAGKALCEHPKIKAIAFVGESRTGSLITKQGADTLKRNHLELGGKNPVIVFGDADLERALDAAIFMIYSVNGERCTSSSRLLVQDTIREEFEAKLIERVNNINVGHPLDPKTEIGPLVTEEHFNKVTRYFDIAKQDGATVAAGGEVVGRDGYFIRPTLFTHANNKMRIAQEEIFGPVLTSIPFSTEDEALEMANDTAYGLTGYVWTNDLTRALRFTDKLEAGMIWVNSENVRHLPTPFGGVKASGIGRDGGDWSFEFYMDQKHIGFATGQHKITKLGAF